MAMIPTRRECFGSIIRALSEVLTMTDAGEVKVGKNANIPTYNGVMGEIGKMYPLPVRTPTPSEVYNILVYRVIADAVNRLGKGRMIEVRLRYADGSRSIEWYSNKSIVSMKIPELLVKPLHVVPEGFFYCGRMVT